MQDMCQLPLLCGAFTRLLLKDNSWAILNMKLQHIVKSERPDPQLCMFLFACLCPPPTCSLVLSRDWVLTVRS